MSKYRELHELTLKDTRGRMLLQPLFIENHNRINTPYPASYTLNAWDNEEKGLRSARIIYVNTLDPSEYNAAMLLLGSWKHWQRLTECGWFQPYLKEWREEMAIRLQSIGVTNLLSQASSERGTTAAKFLAERGWNKALKNSPKVRDKDKNKHDVSDFINDDMERLKLVK